jgi:hypothetical protein
MGSTDLVDSSALVRRALADHGWIDGAWFTVYMVLVAFPLVIPAFIEHRSPWDVLHIGLSAVFLVLGGLLMFVVLRRRVAAERRWLEQLPLPLAIPAYLQLLTEEHAWTTVTVELEYDAPLPDAPALEARLGALRWLEKVITREGSYFRFSSKTLMTKTYSKNGSSYNNGPVHRWFRRCANELLVPLHAERPMRSLKVRT